MYRGMAPAQLVKQGGQKRMLAVLRPGSDALINSDDRSVEAINRQKFVTSYKVPNKPSEVGPRCDVLDVGPNHWLLPFPVVRVNGRWKSDPGIDAQMPYNVLFRHSQSPGFIRARRRKELHRKWPHDGRDRAGSGRARFGVSGVMTFLVNQVGVVLQKGLGRGAAAEAAPIMRFNLNLTWARVDVTGY